MTRQARYNILGIFLLPVAAVVCAWIAKQNGVWQAYSDTYIWLFQMNLIVMVIAGILTGPLLWRSGTELARWIAITPTWVTAGIGSLWYLWRALFPAEIAAGAEYIGVLQYAAVILLAAVFVVLLLRVTRIVPRTA